MKFNCPYWKPKSKIELLQRWILVHSYIYYNLNKSIVSDEMFDKNSLQLYKLKLRYKQEYKQTKYYYAMKEYDGSSGFGIFEKLNHDHQMLVSKDTRMCLNLIKEGVKYYELK